MRKSYTPSLDCGEKLTKQNLQRLQEERIKTTLLHAYTNSPVYREMFDANGVSPSDFSSLSDLAKFPFTTKEDLRQSYPFNFFAVPMDQVTRLHASSGTTGKPTVVGYTKEDISTWSDLVARSIRAAGGRPGMKVHVSYGYGLFTGGLGAHYGAEKLGCTVIPMSGGQTEKQVTLIQDFKPEIIMVTPSYMLSILDEFHRRGIDPRTSSLKIGIFGAEPWTESMRKEIETAFDIDAVDIYGLSEVMGPGVANECVETKDGLTVWEDHFYPEIIDPDTGEVLPDGQTGELVFTSLTKQATPIIRYRTRDITKLLPPTARNMRRIQRITGRSDDMMIIRGVNVFPSHIEEIILALPELSPHFYCELTRPDRMDALTVVTEAKIGVESDKMEAAVRNLKSQIKSQIGITADVNLRPTGSIERSIGKATRIVDLRNA